MNCQRFIGRQLTLVRFLVIVMRNCLHIDVLKQSEVFVQEKNRFAKKIVTQYGSI